MLATSSPLLLCLALSVGQAKPEYLTNIEPTAEETLMLEYINRLRADPAAGAERIATIGDRALGLAKRYKVDVAMMRKEIAALPAVPPMFFHPQLMQAARNHSHYMIVNNEQTHSEEKGKKGFTGVQFPDRLKAAGYRPAGGGECAFLRASDPYQCYLGFVVDWGPGGPGGMQAGRGHRKNLTSEKYREIGIGFIKHERGFSTVINNSIRPGAGRLIGGVVYIDRNRNNFYDVGEGLANAAISTSDGGRVKTWKSGAYALESKNAGTFKVTIRYGAAEMTKEVPAGTDNFKIDWAVPDEQAIEGMKKLIAKVEGIADTEAPAYRIALIDLHVRSAGVQLEPELKKKVDALTGPLAKEITAAQAEVRQAFELEDTNAFGKILTAQAKPFAKTELHAWFHDAGQVFLARAHLKKYEAAKGNLTRRQQTQAEQQIRAGLQQMRQKMSTPEFTNEIDGYIGKFGSSR